MKSTLSDKMKAEAVSNGLCQQWTDEWKDGTTRDEMVEKFVKGLDFCIKTGFPTVEQMKMFIPEANNHGVFIDQFVSVINNKAQMDGDSIPIDVVILNGKCDAHVTVDGCATVIWARHDSKVTVNVAQGGKAFIKCLDNSKVKINCGFFSKAFAYKYSATCDIRAYGDVTIRPREGFYEMK